MLTSNSAGTVFSQVMVALPESSIWLLPVALDEESGTTISKSSVTFPLGDCDPNSSASQVTVLCFTQ